MQRRCSNTGQHASSRPWGGQRMIQNARLAFERFFSSGCVCWVWRGQLGGWTLGTESESVTHLLAPFHPQSQLWLRVLVRAAQASWVRQVGLRFLSLWEWSCFWWSGVASSSKCLAEGWCMSCPEEGHVTLGLCYFRQLFSVHSV